MTTTKLSKAQAARLINRTDRTLRNWTTAGLLPPELHFEDLPRLRELAGYTSMKQDPAQTDQEPGRDG